MANIVCKKWFLFQDEIKKSINCQWNKPNQQIKLHPTSWQYVPLNKGIVMKVRILLIQKRFQPTVDYSNSVFEMWLEAMVDQRSSQLGRVCRESHTCCFLRILQHHWFHFQMTLLAENLLTFLLIFLGEYLVVGLLVLVFGRLNSKIDLKQGFLFLFQYWNLVVNI